MVLTQSWGLPNSGKQFVPHENVLTGALVIAHMPATVPGILCPAQTLQRAHTLAGTRTHTYTRLHNALRGASAGQAE